MATEKIFFPYQWRFYVNIKFFLTSLARLEIAMKKENKKNRLPESNRCKPKNCRHECPTSKSIEHNSHILGGGFVRNSTTPQVLIV